MIEDYTMFLSLYCILRDIRIGVCHFFHQNQNSLNFIIMTGLNYVLKFICHLNYYKIKFAHKLYSALSLSPTSFGSNQNVNTDACITKHPLRHSLTKWQLYIQYILQPKLLFTNITLALLRVLSHSSTCTWDERLLKLTRDSPCEVNNATDAKVIPSP